MYSVKVVEHYKQTNLVVVSDNIDESFDAAEIKQYKLFPKVKGFVEARLYDIDSGGYELEVTTTSAKFRAIYGEERLPQILKDYIENFDTISRSDSVFKDKWRIAAFDEQQLPITMDEVDRVVEGHELYSNICFMGLGGGLVGGCCSLPFAVDLKSSPGCLSFGWGVEYNSTAILVGAGIGASVYSLMSIMMGKTEDRKTAIGAIKKSRKLRKTSGK
jgi:hypothetical protein